MKVLDSISEYTVDDLVSLQVEDSSLAYIKDKAVSAEVMLAKYGSSVRYIQKKDSIIDRVRQQVRMDENSISTSKTKRVVLKIAHDGIMSGHLGIRKTTDRVLNDFFLACDKKGCTSLL